MRKRSIGHDVAEAIVKRGPATVDDLCPLFPKHTREQIKRGLLYARRMAMIRLARPGIGGPGGTSGLWEATGKAACIRPPNSAWELAHSRQILGTWPPAAPGRQYQPLGDWNAE